MLKGPAKIAIFLLEFIVIQAQLVVGSILAGKLRLQLAGFPGSRESIIVRAVQLLLKLRNLTAKMIASSAQVRVVGFEGVKLVEKGVFLHT